SRVARLKLSVESQQSLTESLTGLVLRDHDAETKLAQRIGHRARVIHRCLQARNVAVAVIADRERHTLCRESSLHSRKKHSHDTAKGPCYECSCRKSFSRQMSGSRLHTASRRHPTRPDIHPTAL